MSAGVRPVHGIPTHTTPSHACMHWSEQARRHQYKPDTAMVALQQRMAALMREQEQRGAIIDVEKERNRHMVTSDAPVYVQVCGCV